MPAQRMNMRMIKDLFRLKFSGGLSLERTAAAVGVSKGVVAKYVGLANAAGLDWAAIQDLDEASLAARLQPARHGARVAPEFPNVHRELARKGVTPMLLWQEYQAAHVGERTYQYSQFCDRYRLFAKRLKRSMRQIHRAGEKLFIDFAGTTIGVTEGGRRTSSLPRWAPRATRLPAQPRPRRPSIGSTAWYARWPSSAACRS